MIEQISRNSFNDRSLLLWSIADGVDCDKRQYLMIFLIRQNS
jgi:hypothetical protein